MRPRHSPASCLQREALGGKSQTGTAAAAESARKAAGGKRGASQDSHPTSPPPGCHHIGEGNCSRFLMFPDDLTAKNRSNLQAKKKNLVFLHLFKQFLQDQRTRTPQPCCAASSQGWWIWQTPAPWARSSATWQSAAAPSPAGCSSVLREAGGKVLHKHMPAASPRAAPHLNHRSPNSKQSYASGFFFYFYFSGIG